MLSIVLPTYNERENIERFVCKLNEVCDKNKIKNEIIIVDDNSPDGTGIIANKLSKNKKYNLKVVHRPMKMSLSSAVMDGVNISKGEYFCVMDSDFQHDPNDLPRLYKETKNFDIVLGSRYVKDGVNEESNKLRTLISNIASLLAKIVLDISLEDPESGFAIFKKDILKHIALNPNGFKINLEIIYKSGVVVKEVPITFHKRMLGKSKMNFSEIIKYLKLLYNLRFRS